MYLLICTLNNDLLRNAVNDIVSGDNSVIQATWLTGESGKDTMIRETPAIAGTLKSLLRGKEQDVLLARIEDKSKLDMVLHHMKAINTNDGSMDYFAIPLVS